MLGDHLTSFVTVALVTRRMQTRHNWRQPWSTFDTPKRRLEEGMKRVDSTSRWISVNSDHFIDRFNCACQAQAAREQQFRQELSKVHVALEGDHNRKALVL